MKKEYINMNVFDALQKRFAFLFQEFKNIYISFSGGKDSGVLLNLLLDYRNKYASDRVIGVFHQDFEAQYTVTTDYITRTFKRLENESGIDLYWVCLPMATRTALSNYEMYWYPWDDTKQDIWVRPIPEYPYVINLTKPFTHYRYRMHQEDLAEKAVVQEKDKLFAFADKVKKITQGKRCVVCIGRMLMYFHPAGILETLSRLEMQVEAIILFDNYNPKERKLMVEAVSAQCQAPIIDQTAGQQLLETVDLVLTTHEITNNQDIKQIFLPMLPLVGTSGEIEFMDCIYKTLCRRGEKGGIVYV